MYKDIIAKKFFDYLQKQNYPLKKCGKIIMVKCPLCKEEKFTASLMPNLNKIHCIPCDETLSIADMVRIIEPEYRDKDEVDIYIYLKNLFKLNIDIEEEANRQNKILELYYHHNFSLVPLAKNSHDSKWSYGKAVWEKDWTNKEHREIVEWKNWLESGLNIGVRTGAISGIIVIDIDAMSKEIKDKIYANKATEEEIQKAKEQKEVNLKEILKKLDNPEKNTMYQKTFGGIQLFYKYDADLPKTRINKFQTDIETNGGQVVVQPSLIGNTKREIIGTEIKELPKKLKKILLDEISIQRSISSVSKNKEIEEVDYDEINNLNFGLVSKGNGRSNFLIKMGGVFRSQFDIIQTKKIIYLLNRTLCSPPIPDIGIEQTVLKSIEKYAKFDEQQLAKSILEYLEKAKVARKDEIEIRVLGMRAKGENKERIDKALIHLIGIDKIIKKRNEYHIIEEMNWSDELVNHMKPLINIKIPYFYNYINFCHPDLVILGSQTKFGKTTLAMNFIKRFVIQGIKPYYIYNESSSRFIKTAWKLGMKDKDFFKVRCTDPDKIILRPNSFVIYDWVKPNKEHGFARMDDLFENIVDKLEKTNSFMICFVQLRGNDEFFSKDQIGQHASLLVKYIYDDELGENTKFQLISARDSKYRQKQMEIHCKYLWETKEVKTIQELEEGK